MIFAQIRNLLQQSKTETHLLQLYSFLLKTSLDHDSYFISRTILSASTISLGFARTIFDKSPIIPPLFAWNTIIKEYSKSSIPIESVNLFSRLQGFGLKPDKFTYPFVLKSCGKCWAAGAGGSLHSLVLKAGFDWDRHVNNTLIKMYASCIDVGSARQVFDEMHERDVVSWTSMISGYVTCNNPLDALMVFREMKLSNQKPNPITLVSLLSVSIILLDIRLGECIHSYILTNDIGLDVSLGTALVEMYAKCGRIDTALAIFQSLNEKNLQSWTVMISGLADNGRGQEAISLFNKMEGIGLKPDSLSYSVILSACSHLGLIDESQKYFDRMVNFYNIGPTMEHYGCMVDVFGRAGMIEEAYGIIRSMPMPPNSIILRSFISAYKLHGANTCFHRDLTNLLLKTEPDLGANYVLSANMSSLSGHWSEVDDLRSAMKDKGLKKIPGRSWVEYTWKAESTCHNREHERLANSKYG